MKTLIIALALCLAACSNAPAQTLSATTKYPSNPVSLSASAWDGYVNYFTILNDGGTYKRWYDAFTTSSWTPNGIGHETSSDLATWTKPNLGLVTFGGNTNNNLIIGAQNYTFNVYKNSGSPAYVGILGDDNGAATPCVQVKTSTDGINWSALVTLATNNGKEGQAVYYKNGLWCVYYQQNSTTARGIGVFSCPTLSSTAGDWTDHGVVISAGSQDTQQYTIFLFDINGTTYAAVPNFNLDTQRMDYIRLYSTADGLSFNLENANWLAAGATSDLWDYGMIWIGGVVQYGSEWRVYYGGTDMLHNDSSLPSRSYMGYATFTVSQPSGVVTLHTRSGPVVMATGSSAGVGLATASGTQDLIVQDAVDNADGAVRIKPGKSLVVQ